MTQIVQRESAKILQFPSGGRSNIGRFGQETIESPQLVRMQGPDIVWDNAWYHDEAIGQDERAADRVDSH